MPTDPGRRGSTGLKPFPGRLHVIVPVSNFQRFRTRYDLFRRFASHVEESGAELHVIEAALGEREFEVTSPSNPNHIQVRTNEEIWIKENLINLAFSRLPHDARYIAWCDGDIQFVRPDWVEETLHQLQHYPVVQMWSHIQPLSPNHEPLQVHFPQSFCWTWKNSRPVGAAKDAHPSSLRENVNQNWWGPPGGAWAARRDVLEALGGIIDCSIVGSNDYYMARALIGTLEDMLHPNFQPGYRRSLLAYQEVGQSVVGGNIGYVTGTIFHFWHGKYSQRGYGVRDQILIEGKFNPDEDLRRNWQGVYRLADGDNRRIGRMREAIKTYFRTRNEDSIDID